MRIAMFTPWKAQCGISDYSRQLVQALQKLPEVEEVFLVEPPPDAGRISTWQAFWHKKEWQRHFKQLGLQMNKEGLHIAHIQHQYFFFGGVSPFKNFFPAFVSAIQLPTIMTVHELALPTSPHILKNILVAKTDRATFLAPSLSRLIVHTEADRVTLLHMGCAPEKVTRIPHPVPTPQPMPDAEQAKRVLNLQGKRVLTIFGFLSKKKGHLLALEALRHLPQNVVLVFAGGKHPDDRTSYVEQLKKQIRLWNLEGRVVITDYLPEQSIPTVMAATDIALAPYLQTSGSGSLANLLAYGRAIIASSIPPHIEIAATTDPACLHLVSSDDAEALRRAIEELLGDPHTTRLLREAALRYARAHTFMGMAQNLLAIYKETLRKEAKKR